MYQLEGVKDEKAVSKILAKHHPEGVDKSDDALFLLQDSRPDFCKLIGYASLQDTEKLERIATVITDEGYEKKMDEFENKRDKLHQKVVSAKRSTKQGAAIGLGGLQSATSIADLIENAKEPTPTSEKVIKAQAKMDKYVAKNQLLSEASEYTHLKQGVGAYISIGTEENNAEEKDIFKNIEKSKQPDEDFAYYAFKDLKAFLDDLLKHADRISIMHITDGDQTPTIHTRTPIGLGSLQVKHLVDAKNRESLIISK